MHFFKANDILLIVQTLKPPKVLYCYCCILFFVFFFLLKAIKYVFLKLIELSFYRKLLSKYLELLVSIFIVISK